MWHSEVRAAQAADTSGRIVEPAAAANVAGRRDSSSRPAIPGQYHSASLSLAAGLSALGSDFSSAFFSPPSPAGFSFSAACLYDSLR